MLRALEAVYPEHAWEATRFSVAPKGFWKDRANHRRILDEIATKMDIKQLEDWYRVSARDLRSKHPGAAKLLDQYGGSLSRALQAAYPEHPWRVSKLFSSNGTSTRSRFPRSHWENLDTQRRFFDELAEDLGIEHLDDWCKVSTQEILARRLAGATTIIKRIHGGSLVRALQAAYPEHNWDPVRFAKELSSSSSSASASSSSSVSSRSKRKVPRGYWRDMGNQRRLFDDIARDLGINSNNEAPEEWLGVTVEQVYSRGAGSLLRAYYNGSLLGALRAIYPEHDWLALLKNKNNNNNNNSNDNDNDNNNARRLGRVRRCVRVPNGHWHDRSNHRKFFDELAKELNIERMEDWYRVTIEEVKARGGAGLLGNYYSNSLLRALQAVYPEHPWTKTKTATTTTTTAAAAAAPFSSSSYSRAPRGHWKDPANHRHFLDDLGKQLGVSTPDDWLSKKVTLEQVHARGGGGLLNQYYGGSLLRALRSLYPEHEWPPAPTTTTTTTKQDADDATITKATEQKKKKKVPRGFWSDPANHRRFFDNLAKELAIERLDEWYGVSRAQVRAHGGGALLGEYYGGSLLRALKAVYPEHAWQAWRFSRVPNSNTSTAAATAATSNNDNSTAARAPGGSGSGSGDGRGASSSITSASAEEEEALLLSEYVSALSAELGIQALDDWYRVSDKQILRTGGYSLIRRNGGLALVLKKLYPLHHWDESRFVKAVASGKRASQRWLLVTLQQLFGPGTEIVEDYHHPDLVFQGTGKPMELDIFIPSLSLAFEYQGQQHFNDVGLFGAQSQRRREQDEEKAEACRRAGIALVSVPYSWDRTSASIVEAIRAVRPGALLSTTIAAAAAASASSVPPTLPNKEL